MLLIRAVRVPLTKRTIWQQESEISGIKLENGYTITPINITCEEKVIKIFMAIIITSMPNWPSVKYQGYLHPDEVTCLEQNKILLEQFQEFAKLQGDYDAHFESFCLQIETYPIQGFNNTSA